jgi:hypothetical protein
MVVSRLLFEDKELINIISELSKKYEQLTQRKKELISKIKEYRSGILIDEYVKCGKKNCKCTSGDLHGPYYYHYYWKKGKLRKKYVCPVRKPNEFFNDLYIKIKNNRENKEIQREIKRINKILLRIDSIKTNFKNDLSEILGFY